MSDAELAYAVGQTVEVTAMDVAQGGWCVARPEGLPVLFVRHALPGERVLARVTEVTSRFARADAIEVREASPDRVEPPCPNAHPGGCGGCDWQHASLPAQRALKAAVIAQQLRRVAGLELDAEITVEALTGDEGTADQPAETTEAAATSEAGQPGLGWRTRVQFAVRPDGLAGLRAHRSHEVVDIGDCPIAHPAHPRSWPARLLLGGRGHGRGRGRQPGTRPPGPRGHPHQGGPRAAWPPGPRFRARPPGGAR